LLNKNDSHSQWLPLHFISLIALVTSLAPPPQQWVERESYLMGTTLRLVVAAASRQEALRATQEAFEAVRNLDDLLSTWREDTEIAKLNHAPPGRAVPLSPYLYSLLRDASRWSRLTDAAFDPAIGSLVDAWDLRGAGRIPDRPSLRRALGAAGLGRFVFADETRTVTRTDSAAWIDTGGFGKGVALREARRALLRRGVTSASLNFGGQVLVMGSNRSGEDWMVPVAHPSHRAEPAAWLRFRNRSASTSSQSERFVTVNGERLGHILDPRTGQPVPAWGSVTVVAEDPGVADVVSTALLVLGPESGLEWARSRRDIGVLFLIERKGRVERRWNDALKDFLMDSTIKPGG
jgi:thiamine biosynthesis lipoprotein